MDIPPKLTAAAPVSQSARIGIIDSLRGFAILGILLMNIPSFSLAGPVGHDPFVLNEHGSNFRVWYLVEWIPEGTQRAIFSMLFGAGILLFMSNLEKKVEGIKAADYFFRRQLWLLVFGLFDIYVLLWFGDILFDYAIYGMLLFTFRKLPPKALIILAAASLIMMVARENRTLYQDKKMIHTGERIAALDTIKVKLTSRQQGELRAMNDFKERFDSSEKNKRMVKSIDFTRGSYEDVYTYRTDRYMSVVLEWSYMGVWDVLLFMFLGMALFKLGILTGNASTRIYWIMMIGGLGLGLLISWLRLKSMIDLKYNMFEYTKNVNVDLYTISRALRSLGLLAFLILLFKSGWFKWLFNLMRPVGQMAFTNYLTQSFLCGLIFYGVGFGYYGKLERYEVYLVVGAIWLLQIIWSNLWLRFFYFGPLEWCWRSLTYWKRQPLRRRSESKLNS